MVRWSYVDKLISGAKFDGCGLKGELKISKIVLGVFERPGGVSGYRFAAHGSGV
jgi:hypothetical protein